MTSLSARDVCAREASRPLEANTKVDASKSAYLARMNGGANEDALAPPFIRMDKAQLHPVEIIRIHTYDLDDALCGHAYTKLDHQSCEHLTIDEYDRTWRTLRELDGML